MKFNKRWFILSTPLFILAGFLLSLNQTIVYAGSQQPATQQQKTPDPFKVASNSLNSISGVVHNEMGEPLSGIRVSTILSNTDSWEPSWSSVTTDENGEYQILNLDSGLYAVEFEDWNNLYGFSYYSGTTTLTEATLLTISDTSVITNINATLELGGGVAGTITMFDGQAPEHANVYLYHYNGAWWEHVGGDELYNGNNTYAIDGLASGAYRLQVIAYHAGNEFTEWYDDAETLLEATDIIVTSEMTTTLSTQAIGSNDPIAHTDGYETNEDDLLTVTAPGVLANDVNGNISELTAVLVNDVQTGTLTLDTDGSFIYSPPLNFNGAVSFTYVAHDGVADSEETTVEITVLPQNDAPILTLASDHTEVFIGEELNFAGHIVDVDIDDAHTFVWDFGNGYTSTEPISSTYTYEEVGTYTASLTVHDTAGASSYDEVTVTVSPHYVYLPVMVKVND